MAAAALSHAVLAQLDGLGAADVDAYGRHEHGAVGPVLLLAGLLLGALLVRIAAAALGRREGRDPVLALAARIGPRPPVPACALVAVGTLTALIAMEFGEQLAGEGRIEGCAAALGGNVPLGLAVVAGAAAAMTFAGLGLARWVTRATRMIAAAVGAIAERGAAPAAAHPCRIGRVPLGRVVPAGHVLSRGFGLRAPPI